MITTFIPMNFEFHFNEFEQKLTRTRWWSNSDDNKSEVKSYYIWYL